MCSFESSMEQNEWPWLESSHVAPEIQNKIKSNLFYLENVYISSIRLAMFQDKIFKVWSLSCQITALNI